MTYRRLTIRPLLALVTLAVAVGCGDTPTRTGLGVEPNLGKGNGKGPGGDDGSDNPGSPSYTYTFDTEGDVYTNPTEGIGGGNVGSSDANSIVMDGCCDAPEAQEQLVLSPEFESFLEGTDQCFTPPIEFSGAMRRDNKDLQAVTATFYFVAKDRLGAELKYVLELQGIVGPTTDEDIFPPEPGQSTTIDFGSAEMGTEGKGKANKGTACTGSMDGFTASVTVVGFDPA